MRYYASGETRLATGNMFTDRLFTGQRQIAELGIYQFGARFYSPKLGRFLSADTIVPQPFNPQSLNRYSYALNNPLRYIDPSGHYFIECDFWVGCGSTGGTSDDGGGGGDGDGGGGDGDGGDGGDDAASDPLTVTPTTCSSAYCDPEWLNDGDDANPPPPVGSVDIGKAIIGGVLIGLGVFVVVGGLVIIAITAPAAAVETAVLPPVGASHMALGTVGGGLMVVAGVVIVAAGVYSIYISGVIPGTSP